jgi:hypothetical protein
MSIDERLIIIGDSIAKLNERLEALGLVLDESLYMIGRLGKVVAEARTAVAATGPAPAPTLPQDAPSEKE